MDTGIIHYLKQATFTGFSGAEAGKSFEHYVFLELMAYRKLNGLQHSIQYWRTTNGSEVDFVLQKGTIAIECKSTNAPAKADLKGLIKFSEDHNNAFLHLVCLVNKKRLTTIDGIQITIWPIQEFLDNLWSGVIL